MVHGPALSPEADRVVYTRVESQGGGAHLWISALAGGAPVPLTNDSASTEFPGSWSPDGNWFVYPAYRNDHMSLMKVKASGQAAPIAVKADADRPTRCPAGRLPAIGSSTARISILRTGPR